MPVYVVLLASVFDRDEQKYCYIAAWSLLDKFVYITRNIARFYVCDSEASN